LFDWKIGGVILEVFLILAVTKRSCGTHHITHVGSSYQSNVPSGRIVGNKVMGT